VSLKIKRAVLQAMREGSFLFSILPCRIAYFFDNEKSKKTKKKKILLLVQKIKLQTFIINNHK
jgi:hypothetical protein